MTTTVSAIDLPFDEAIAYLRQKTNATSEHWADVFGEANARAFTVAGAATEDLVGDFRKAVAGAIENGTSLGEFAKSFDAITAKHGWLHNGTPAWRSRIIFETNLGMAYSAGRYVQQTEPETLAAFPFWQYVHSGAAHPRPEHLALNGLTLRADDPFWKTHYPPNGWGCGCWVRPVSARGLSRMGKSGPDTAPVIDTRPWRNPRTGEIKHVPIGIDPGFDYNPGQVWKAERVDLPANATLKPPAPIDPADLLPAQPARPEAPIRPGIDPGPVEIEPPVPGNPTPPIPPAPRDVVEDFARRVLAGDINDPARAIYAAELPAPMAARLAGTGGNRVELSAFRVLKVAGRAGEMAGRASTAHPEVTSSIWGHLQEMLDQGEAYASVRHGWPQVEVVHRIEGRPWRLILRRVLQPDGTTRLDVPTLMRISDREAARFGRVRGRERLGK
ncbi:phage minor head protein [Ancylobacter pratisalsi]|uniref:Phage head morphogenesis domain-containing protein n=1 Tax=Ancylobacter pratisalsi TaxID=1745854 RepID=A0A6P1YMV0_9HYPH|nr:phage minor head protein [Ancylobacter pratisalsi]QIB34757.1 hypothetical protein G3A50_14355 [Ancylobacter pratisalsi]